MDAFEALKELTSRMSSAMTVDDIGGALMSLAEPFGVSNVFIIDARKLFGPVAPAVVFVSESLAVIGIFDEEAPVVQHPAYARANDSDRPFLMSQLMEEMGDALPPSWWLALPPEQRHNDGFVVPIHHDHKLAWLVSYTGHQPEFSQVAQSLMAAAAYAAFARFGEMLEGIGARSPLSPREGECLRWVADGKTDIEVGQILSISPRTVRFHINNAKAKLGVATRIQAVVKQAGGGS